MKTIQQILPKWFFLSLSIVLIVPNISLAMSSSTKMNTHEEQTIEKLQQYSWYDGNQKRTVWVNPDLIAEFSVPIEEAVIKSSSIESNTKTPFIQFLNVEKGEHATIKIPENNLDKNIKTQRSPVFHSSKSTTGIKKALPGNVIIQMQRNWNQEQIENWFKTYNLTVIKPLNFAPNTFLIHSKAGLESLNLANKLYETGDVILASPNWWQERVTR